MLCLLFQDSSNPSIPEFHVPDGIHDVQGFMQKALAIAQKSLDGNTKVNTVIIRYEQMFIKL